MFRAHQRTGRRLFNSHLPFDYEGRESGTGAKNGCRIHLSGDTINAALPRQIFIEGNPVNDASKRLIEVLKAAGARIKP
jgi:hypothetical protein